MGDKTDVTDVQKSISLKEVWKSLVRLTVLIVQKVNRFSGGNDFAQRQKPCSHLLDYHLVLMEVIRS